VYQRLLDVFMTRPRPDRAALLADRAAVVAL
jgi:hypothetical protein